MKLTNPIKAFKQRRDYRKAIKEGQEAKARYDQLTLHPETVDSFSREEMLQIYRDGVAKGHALGYAEGRADGISIAKNAAQKQLKELIWQQNKNQNSTTPTVPRTYPPLTPPQG